jgi:hypothetical protein
MKEGPRQVSLLAGRKNDTQIRGKLNEVVRQSTYLRWPETSFGHLKHAHLALAVEDRAHRVVCVDLSTFFLVLQAAFLDVVPAASWSVLSAGSGFEPTIAESFSSGLNGLHERCVGLAFGGCFLLWFWA